MRRYLATSSTATAFTYTAGARLTAPPANVIPMSRNLILNLIFMGAGADNSTFDYRVLGLMRCTDATGAIDTVTYLLVNLGVGTCTLGAMVGSTGGTAILSTERLADGVTWTISSETSAPDGPMTDIETAYSEGTSQAYAPADDTFGMLILPACGRFEGIVVDFDLTGATSANCLYDLSEV